MSASQPSRVSIQGDRFIPNRANMNLDVSHHNIVSENTPSSTNPTTSSSTSADTQQHSSVLTTAYKSSLSSSLFGEQNIEECEILALKTKPPKAILQQCQLNVLYTQNLTTLKKESHRNIPTTSERVLDAPGLVDDYYLNLVDWSQSNVLCVALGSSVYLWNAITTTTTQLLEYPNKTITSVNWSPDSPQFLAVGTNDSLVELWDVTRGTQVRSMSGHAGRVGAMSWNKHVLSSGAFDGSIHNHDVRQAHHLIGRFERHIGEVCGLRWSTDGKELASGGNDNMVIVWELDMDTPKFCFEEHVAAVKALGWCPWLPHLLATGGGSADRTIKFWNTQTGTLLNSVDTESQVCGIQWSKHQKELVSSHGFSKNQLCVWKYPSMTQIGELRGHTQRIVQLTMSPDGTTICSGSSDETLRFWRVFEPITSMKSLPPKDPHSQQHIHKIR